MAGSVSQRVLFSALLAKYLHSSASPSSSLAQFIGTVQFNTNAVFKALPLLALKHE
jgi:hypothetical protein